MKNRNSAARIHVANATIAVLFLIVLCFGSAQKAKAQTPVALAPVAHQQFFLGSGLPNAGGCLFTYNSGTSVPLATYTDYSGLYQNSNPILLDATGSATIYLANANYRFVLYSAGGTNCATGQQLWMQDNVNAWQSTNGLTTLALQPVIWDPVGTAGLLDYNSTYGCFRGFTISQWSCLATLDATQNWSQQQNFQAGITGTGNIGNLSLGPGVLGTNNNWTATQTFSNGIYHRGSESHALHQPVRRCGFRCADGGGHRCPAWQLSPLADM